MASLKEIKGRIASVNSTLKITSAMKLVASAKLRKAQSAIGNMEVYENKLNEVLSDLLASVSAGQNGNGLASVRDYVQERQEIKRVALVCLSSNSSLCGGFNANVIRKATETIAEYRSSGVEEITVFSIGNKVADAMRKAGYPSSNDYSDLSASPTYSAAAELGNTLIEGFVSGRFDKVEFIYNHFKSTASQPTTREVYLPLTGLALSEDKRQSDGIEAREFIIEPNPEEMIGIMLPKVLLLKVYTVLLDSSAAEHAARTVAMQVATDNGNDLLQALTLEYNKGRQNKITSELLDLESGSAQD